MGFYWSYTLLLKSPVLVRSCGCTPGLGGTLTSCCSLCVVRVSDFSHGQQDAVPELPEPAVPMAAVPL